MDVMRLFVAIELPESHKVALYEQCDGLRRTLRDGLRWVPVHQLHLTLVFLGNVARSRLGALGETLRASTTEISPFEVRLDAGGWFPPKGPARVLWAGIDPKAAVQRLREVVQTSLERTGFAKRDRRPYHPHVTLARSRPPLSKAALLDAPDVLEEIRSEPFDVSEMTLFESHTERSGARHDVVERIPLRGSSS